jgi:hypothetical protein
MWPLLLVAALLVFWYWQRYRPAAPVPSPQITPGPFLEAFDGCPLEGDATNPDVQELNRLKNRTTLPQPQQIDPAVTLAAILEPGNDRHRWDDRRAAEITGYVVDVKVGGVETVNCRATDPQHRDTDIDLVLDPMNNGETHRVIVEVTPRIRSFAEHRGEDWSTSALRDHLQGRWVRVTGWLLFDSEHENQSLNTAPRRQRDWRATAWELHPVTSLEVVSRLN